jgi:hypothetical protein
MILYRLVGNLQEQLELNIKYQMLELGEIEISERVKDDFTS